MADVVDADEQGDGACHQASLGDAERVAEPAERLADVVDRRRPDDREPRTLRGTDDIPNDDVQIWATYSTDGGAAFVPDFRVSAGTSNAEAAQTGFDYGDCMHAAFQSGAFYPAWPDNSNSAGGNADGTLHPLDLYTAKVAIP